MSSALILLRALAVAVVAIALAAAPSAAADVKPPLSGLLDRDGVPPAELADVVTSYVVNVDWRELQPTSGDTLERGVLDRALAEAADRGARVKLRVMAGIAAPQWAKDLGGGAVRLSDPHDGGSGTVPRFWSKSFGTAYKRLQSLLAERYDAHPQLAEVVVSRCTTFYAEPFVRQTSVASNRRALLAAGYTPRKDKACHRGAVSAHRVWQRTRSGLALNPAQLVTKSGGRTVDDRFTVAIMRHCRDTLAARCILENNSIRSPITSLDPDPDRPHYARMYRAMVRIAPTLAFQTATSARIGSCGATLDWAADRGAAYVELPWDAAEVCSAATLERADRRLG